MTASELTSGQWFKVIGEERIFQRLPGEAKNIKGILGVPVNQLRPILNQTGYISTDEKVELYKEESIRIS